MMKIYIFFVFALLPFFLIAQNEGDTICMYEGSIYEYDFNPDYIMQRSESNVFAMQKELVPFKDGVYSFDSEEIYWTGIGLPLYYIVGRITNNQRQGDWVCYYVDLSKKIPKYSVFKIMHYEDNLLDGEYVVYKKNGKVKYKTNFSNGTGYYKDYYASGWVKSEGHMENGWKVGEWRYYHKGRLDIIVTLDSLKMGYTLRSPKIAGTSKIVREILSDSAYLLKRVNSEDSITLLDTIHVK